MKFRVIISVFIFSLFITNCASTNRNKKKEAKQYLKIGTSYLEQGRYPQALTALLKSTKLDGENHIAFNHLGLAYYVREKFNLAEKNMRRAITIKPKYTDAKINLGLVLLEKKQYNKAIKYLKEATRDLEYPQPEKSFSNLGLAYMGNKQYKKAITYLKKSLKIRRESCNTYYYYARSLYEIAEYHKANQAFSTSIMFCQRQKFPDPVYYSALSHLKVGHKELAIAKLKEIQEYYGDTTYAAEATKMLEVLEKGQK